MVDCIEAFAQRISEPRYPLTKLEEEAVVLLQKHDFTIDTAICRLSYAGPDNITEIAWKGDSEESITFQGPWVVKVVKKLEGENPVCLGRIGQKYQVMSGLKNGI